MGDNREEEVIEMIQEFKEYAEDMENYIIVKKTMSYIRMLAQIKKE